MPTPKAPKAKKPLQVVFYDQVDQYILDHPELDNESISVLITKLNDAAKTLYHLPDSREAAIEAAVMARHIAARQ
jgi:hypothetical protein